MRIQRQDAMAASRPKNLDDVVSIEAVLQLESGAVEVKLPKLESEGCQVVLVARAPEHAAIAKPNLPCFKQPSLTRGIDQNRTG